MTFIAICDEFSKPFIIINCKYNALQIISCILKFEIPENVTKCVTQ